MNVSNSVNLEEGKKYSKTSLGVGQFDCLREGQQMYSNEAIKFPKPKKPANNECFENKGRRNKDRKCKNNK
jgi:hypothetical protein